MTSGESGTGPQSPLDFARLASELGADLEEEPTIQRICEQAVKIIPGCHGASVTIRRRSGHETLAASSSAAAEFDELQYALDEGPCLDAADEHGIVRSNDVEADVRWPRWGPKVAPMGARSLVCIHLSARGESLGAINLYSNERQAFGNDGFELAVIYATHAAQALGAARTATGLSTALSSRHQIGLAQGILMERYGLSVGRAFEVLQRYASHSNTKLRDVAAELVAATQQQRTSAAGLEDAPDGPPG